MGCVFCFFVFSKHTHHSTTSGPKSHWTIGTFFGYSKKLPKFRFSIVDRGVSPKFTGRGASMFDRLARSIPRLRWDAAQMRTPYASPSSPMQDMAPSGPLFLVWCVRRGFSADLRCLSYQRTCHKATRFFKKKSRWLGHPVVYLLFVGVETTALRRGRGSELSA